MQKIILIIFILFIGGCASQRPGVDPLFVIYPYDFYEKFNLRTVISSYRNQLAYFCASYPKDFFQEKDIRIADGKFLVLDNGERLLTFEMIAYNQVIMTDEIPQSGYKGEGTYTFYYNKEADDFRVSEFLIDKKSDCKEYSYGNFKVDSNKIIKNGKTE